MRLNPGNIWDGNRNFEKKRAGDRDGDFNIEGIGTGDRDGDTNFENRGPGTGTENFKSGDRGQRSRGLRSRGHRFAGDRPVPRPPLEVNA